MAPGMTPECRLSCKDVVDVWKKEAVLQKEAVLSVFTIEGLMSVK